MRMEGVSAPRAANEWAFARYSPKTGRSLLRQLRSTGKSDSCRPSLATVAGGSTTGTTASHADSAVFKVPRRSTFQLAPLKYQPRQDVFLADHQRHAHSWFSRCAALRRFLGQGAAPSSSDSVSLVTCTVLLPFPDRRQDWARGDQGLCHRDSGEIVSDIFTLIFSKSTDARNLE